MSDPVEQLDLRAAVGGTLDERGMGRRYDLVVDKDASNFCDYFDPAGAAGAAGGGGSDARDELDKLFGKK